MGGYLLLVTLISLIAIALSPDTRDSELSEGSAPSETTSPAVPTRTNPTP